MRPRKNDYVLVVSDEGGGLYGAFVACARRRGTIDVELNDVIERRRLLRRALKWDDLRQAFTVQLTNWNAAEVIR